MTKTVAVVLSGCGFLDGAEIHEAVITLLHIAKNGAVARCYAPNIPQKTVTNHLTKDAASESRNVLVESARIARCEVRPLAELQAADADALVFPGGFGAALNLCDFGQKGADCVVEADVERVVRVFYAAQKPMGFICIAPAIAARVLGPSGVRVTIGTDAGTAAALQKMGAVHVNKNVDEICLDEAHRVVTTPAYMLAQNPAEVEAGVSMLIGKVLEWS